MFEHPTQSGSAGSMKQAFLWTLLPIVGLSLIALPVADAQVLTDITPSGLNTQIDQVGNSYNITGGTRPGGGPNLFHSFGQFDVGQIAGINDIANFLNDSGIDTTNILARVTGPNNSQIYGTIQTTGFGAANLFLINPSGIVLGPGASLNVGGSVTFTTAQYIRLFDGLANNANFYANPASDGSILTIDPSAFEFSSATPAAYGFSTAPDPNATITVQGSNVSVSSGQSISLVGGEVMIGSGAQLTAPSGTILLATAASPGEFDVNTLQSLPNVDGTSFTSFGTISMAPDSSIAVHGASTVWITGGQLVLSVENATLNTSAVDAPTNTISLGLGSSIVTSNSGAGSGADVQITAGTINLDGSTITTETFGDGNGGNITANVNTLSLTNLSAINTFNYTTGQGRGGNVVIQGLSGASTSPAGTVTIDNTSVVTTQSIFGTGRGGDVRITANTLQVTNGSLIESTTLFGTGRSGDITLNVGDLTISGGSVVRTTDFSLGVFDLDGALDPSSVGAAGNLSVQGVDGTAASSVVLSENSQLGTQAENGAGGSVSIKTSRLSLDGSSSIFSITNGLGLGGDINVMFQQASLQGAATITTGTFSSDPAAGDGGTIMLQGVDGNGGKADALTISGFSSGIRADSFGSGTPGNIAINAKTVRLTDQALIAGGTPLTSGTGGRVTINANVVSIASGSQISSQSFAFDAGQVTITAADQLILNDGSIATSTSSPTGGRGGDVVLNVGSARLTNGATITSSASNTGIAGNIDILANGSVTMTSGSSITASSTGSGDAGNISITSGSTFLMQNSSVTTEASQASGGQITINAPYMIRLIDSTVSTSVAGAANDSNGGNISIDPDFVILKGSQILAQAVAGTGGAIGITAGLFLADASSVVDASSTQGVSGTVQINAPINNLSEVIAPMPESLLAVQTLLRAACAARMAQGGTSSFVERGRDSIPSGPEGLLASPYLPVTSSSSAQRHAKSAIGTSGIQLRRLSEQESPAPIIIRSEHAACAS
ncbi:MAG: filamentous hemagglutinin N-terminal domain-containing protein [Nitrospira sp.]|nr:filamentous hemagglutinin N-terminal domain-containing protein [Nitrospira sp.]MBH0187103.1 filamentous hemagglutinin N-terminal domain-containing protein [Nitrospira sp.]